MKLTTGDIMVLSVMALMIMTVVAEGNQEDSAGAWAF